MSADQEKLESDGRLDGCYVIKTDLTVDCGDAPAIHGRYKDLALVETAFRTMKSDSLDARPIYVCRADRTQADFLITMLSYKIERYLRKHWSDLNITVSEGIQMLSIISGLLLTMGDQKVVRVPEPGKECKELLERINVTLPDFIPYNPAKVVTNKRLQTYRKN